MAATTLASPNMFVSAAMQQGMSNAMIYPQMIGFAGFIPVMATPMGGAMMNCMMTHPTDAVSAGTQERRGRSDKSAPKKKGNGQRSQFCTGKARVQSFQQQTQTPLEVENASKGVISMLQEFVQFSKQFPSPPHRAVLQWRFQSRKADSTTLKFRAKVSFMLDGIAHHAMGSWQTSKKLAQRDAAERCLGFFVTSWGSYLVEHGDRSSNFQTSVACDTVSILEEFSQSFPPCEGHPPSWSVESDGEGCCASAEISILGVLHRFSGALKFTVEDAKADAAKRILWYLQCPGFEDAFELDPLSPAMVADEIPSAPATWAAVEGSSEGDDDAAQAAEQKTLQMQVQNRLQQQFAGQLKLGQSVVEWSFETNLDDSESPLLFRAKAHVPAVGKTFEGGWARGQDDAQLETCQCIIAFLDSGCLSPVASTACSLASGEESESESRAEAQETTSTKSEGNSQRKFSCADNSCEDGEVERD